MFEFKKIEYVTSVDVDEKRNRFIKWGKAAAVGGAIAVGATVGDMAPIIRTVADVAGIVVLTGAGFAGTDFLDYLRVFEDETQRINELAEELDAGQQG